MTNEENIFLRDIKFNIKGDDYNSYLIEQYYCPRGDFFTRPIRDIFMDISFSCSARFSSGMVLNKEELKLGLADLMFTKKDGVIFHWTMTPLEDDTYEVYITEDVTKPFYLLPGDKIIFPDTITDEEKKALEEYEDKYQIKPSLNEPYYGTSYCQLVFGLIRPDKRVLWVSKLHRYEWYDPKNPDHIEQIQLDKERDEMIDFFKKSS